MNPGLLVPVTICTLDPIGQLCLLGFIHRVYYDRLMTGLYLVYLLASWSYLGINMVKLNLNYLHTGMVYLCRCQ